MYKNALKIPTNQYIRVTEKKQPVSPKKLLIWKTNIN